MGQGGRSGEVNRVSGIRGAVDAWCHAEVPFRVNRLTNQPINPALVTAGPARRTRNKKPATGAGFAVQGAGSGYLILASL